MTSPLQQELDTLRQEVVRLTQELDQTSSEKIQSAQYGLVLLEEKEGLEARCQVSLYLLFILDLMLNCLTKAKLILTWTVSFFMPRASNLK